MISRARSLLRPSAADPVVSRVDDATALWLAGVLWIVVCGVVARLELAELMPAALAGGLVLAASGRRLLTLYWFPVVLAVALLVEPVAMAFGRPRVPALAHLDLVVLAVLTLAVARVLTGGPSRIPILLRRPTLRLLIAAVVVVVALASTAGGVWMELRAVTRGLTAFVVGVTIFGRPQRASRLWSAAAVMSGGIAASAASVLAVGGLPALASFGAAADRGWEAPRALAHTLLFAAPVTMGFSLDRERRSERWGLMTLGILALAAERILSEGAFSIGPAVGSTLEASRLAVSYVLLASAMAGSVWVAVLRSRERWSWIGLALGFGSLAVSDAPAVSFAATPVLLLAVASVGAVVTALDRKRCGSASDIADEASAHAEPAPAEAGLEEPA